MSFEKLFRERAKNEDYSELTAEFGISKEQAIEISWRILRAGILGFKTGVTLALGSLLMVLGGWAVWKFFAR